MLITAATPAATMAYSGLGFRVIPTLIVVSPTLCMTVSLSHATLCWLRQGPSGRAERRRNIGVGIIGSLMPLKPQTQL